jgi:hypothetical protein
MFVASLHRAVLASRRDRFLFGSVARSSQPRLSLTLGLETIGFRSRDGVSAAEHGCFDPSSADQLTDATLCQSAFGG